MVQTLSSERTCMVETAATRVCITTFTEYDQYVSSVLTMLVGVSRAEATLSINLLDLMRLKQSSMRVSRKTCFLIQDMLHPGDTHHIIS